MALKKKKSIRVFFIAFLGKTLLYMIAAFMVWLTLLMLVFNNEGVVRPANFTEKQLEQWLEQVKQDKSFDFSQFPEDAGYLLYEDGQKLDEHHISESNQNRIMNLIQDEKLGEVSSIGSKQLRVIYLGDQTCVVLYHVEATFTNGVLKKICPNIGAMILVLMLILELAAVTISILQTSKRMEAEVAKLKQAAKEIEQQNLDFGIQQSSLKEFNQVLQSLDQLRENLSVSLREQWKLEQQKKQQMSALAHDIKTPLTIIDGNAQLLLESELEEDQRQFSESIGKSAGQIQKYVYQIIEISKDRAYEAQPEQIKVDDLIADLEQTAHDLSQPKQLSLQTQYGQLPELIQTDRQLLQRIFTNVLDNAVQYSPECGQITVAVSVVPCEHLSAHLSDHADHYLEFRIIDSGPGFSELALQHARQQFYQDDDARSSRQHFGLGLFIVDQIVKVLNGSLELKNEPEQGACVTIYLPLDA